MKTIRKLGRKSSEYRPKMGTASSICFTIRRDTHRQCAAVLPEAIKRTDQRKKRPNGLLQTAKSVSRSTSEGY
ncbi:hypothetical protein [Spirosoma sp. KNUC1025]|uniref:hypothetical protein n=1 Tax=Spirosoma sp. KNUC1025 TaxID=2894082 RepID=UPI0038691501|nr:hypothetical protein LN737_01360 [Spirosoma sp. KNUC1025]